MTKSSSARRVRVAVAHHDGQPGEFARNASLTIDLAAQAASMGATFCLFPEMNISGYEVQVDWRKLAMGAEHAALEKVARAAVKLKIAIAAGFIERWAKGTSINHTVYRADGTRAFQRKSGGPGAVEDGCVSVMTRTLIRVGALRLGILICADGEHEQLWRQLRRARANVIAWPTAGWDRWVRAKEMPNAELMDAVAERAAHARLRAQERALSMRAALLVSNPIGPTPHVAWPGNSGIVDRDGSLRAWLPEEAVVERMRPGVVVADITV